MTSRSILGGNEQSIGSHYGHDTRPDSYFPTTYASAAYEPDANSSPLTVPPWSANLALGELPLFAPVRAPFEHRKILQALIDVGVIAFWVVLILMSAASIPVALFMILFCRF